jgi:alpha-tubulin suppressor-like RCC1 family protein
MAACNAVFGLDGYESADGGAVDASPGDVSVESDSVPVMPGGAALVVASADAASYWCVVTVDGDVECWGENEVGELGDGTTTSSATPVKVKGLPEPATYVTIGTATTCALTKSGGVYCWGYGANGELGNDSNMMYSTTAVPVHGLASGVTSISCGNAVACAVQNGALLCWGDGQVQLLGTNQTTDALVPTRVPQLQEGVTSVSVGNWSACAIRDGAASCWGGFDRKGELGNNSTTGSNTPVPVQGLASGVGQVSVGSASFACALKNNGGVMCWGNGEAGELGSGQFAVSPVPVQVQGLETGVTALSAGSDSVTAVKEDGTVVAWGFATDGALGDGPDSGLPIGNGLGSGSPVPVAVMGLSGPLSVSTGRAPCVVTMSGGVACWGITAENAVTPVPVSALGNATAITTGGNLNPDLFACAVASNGNIQCWGGNGAGQLGNGTTTGSSVPVNNFNLPIGIAVSASAEGTFACAVSSGAAYCWGDNSSGQLGNGGTTSSLMAVPVHGLPGKVLSVAAGYTSACAITTTGADSGAGGAAYCWGNNTFGQLGNNSTATSLVPVLVTGLDGGVTAISLGALSACALLVDGSVDCWGANETGQLGNGNQNTEFAPTPVAGLSGAAIAISAGWYSSCAVIAGGTIQCWGDNSWGELGGNGFNQSLVPVPVSNIGSGASQVSVGAQTACAIVGGGAVCWGSGPLGSNLLPEIQNDFPAGVTGLGSGVSAIATGLLSACAIVNQNVQCWGLNTAGQIGNGGAIDESVPTPVAGFP